MVNEVTLIGRLGQDPDSRTSSGGTQITRLSVATDHRQKNASGQYEDVTSWHRVTCFGKTAENAAKYLQKGRQVYIRGRIQYSKYEKDGVERWSTEIVANEVRFLGSKNDSGGSRSAAGNDGYGGGSSTPNDNDIPFNL